MLCLFLTALSHLVYCFETECLMVAETNDKFFLTTLIDINKKLIDQLIANVGIFVQVSSVFYYQQFGVLNFLLFKLF